MESDISISSQRNIAISVHSSIKQSFFLQPQIHLRKAVYPGQRSLRDQSNENSCNARNLQKSVLSAQLPQNKSTQPDIFKIQENNNTNQYCPSISLNNQNNEQNYKYKFNTYERAKEEILEIKDNKNTEKRIQEIYKHQNQKPQNLLLFEKKLAFQNIGPSFGRISNRANMSSTNYFIPKPSFTPNQNLLQSASQAITQQAEKFQQQMNIETQYKIFENNEDSPQKQQTFARWINLGIISMISVFAYQQRSALPYLYALTSDAKADKFVSLVQSYPQLKENYGLLTGVGFDVPFALFSILSGILCDKIQSEKTKEYIFAASSILWSLSTIFQGQFDSYEMFYSMRLVQGVLQSVMTPLGFSLIHRWFPEKNRATANSIFYGSQYLGSAISSLNLIAAEDFGWREDYILMGTLGVVAGFIGLLGLREVEKECQSQNPDQECIIEGSKEKALTYFEQLKEDFSDLSSNKVGTFLILAACSRFISLQAIKIYTPSFFTHFYPQNIQQFSELSALMESSLGLVSNLMAGVLADQMTTKKQQDNYYKAVAASCVVSVPLYGLSFLSQDNFMLSISMYSLNYGISQVWLAPFLAKLQQTAKPTQEGFILSFYLLCATLTGSITSFILDKFQNILVHNYGEQAFVITLYSFVGMSLLGTIPFIWKADQEQKKQEKINQANEEKEKSLIIN